MVRHFKILKNTVCTAVLLAMIVAILPMNIMAETEDNGIIIRYFEDIGMFEVVGEADAGRVKEPVTIKVLDGDDDSAYLLQTYVDETGAVNAELKLKTPVTFSQVSSEYTVGVNVDGTYYPITVTEGKYLILESCLWNAEDKSITVSGRYLYDEIGVTSALTLEILDSQDASLHSRAITVAADYTYETNIVLPQCNIPYGICKIIVKNGTGLEEETTFEYKNPQIVIDDLEQTRTTANFSTTLKDTENLELLGLSDWENSEGTGLTDFSDDIFAIMAQSSEEYVSADIITKEADRASLTNAINNAADADAVKTALFTDYKDLFTVQECSAINQYNKLTDTEKDSVINVLLNAEIFTKYDDLEEKFAETVILDSVNKSTMSSQLKEIAEGNPDYVTISSALTLTEWTTILSKKPYTSIATLESDCEAVISARPQGGGHQGGGSYTGSSGGSSFGVSSQVQQMVNKQVFDDIENVAWAKDAINELYKREIISGVGNNKFNPNGEVKREELIKMLVCALGKEAGSGEVHFSDAQPDAWYYPYIVTAYNLGITAGKDDGTFGVGTGLTRQDAAVLCYRSFAALSAAEPELKESFADNSRIADYAKTAVNTLHNLGLISGMEDGRFAPEEVCTRAQMAQMLYSILLFVEE